MLQSYDLSSRMYSKLTKHDVVLRISMHISLIKGRREDLDIATTAIDLLLVLHRELDYERLALITDRIEPGRECIKAGILAGLKAWKCKTSML